ncbi:MAG: alanine racemase [Armatimonadota bacterium]
MTVPLAALSRVQSRTWATIDLDAIAGNVLTVRSLIPRSTALMAVVKADAYGHGAAIVAETAVAAGASWLGVATAEEALELRSAAVDARILILGPVAEGWLAELVAAGCALTVADRPALNAIQRMEGEDRPRVHFKVDTGMTRIGIDVADLADLITTVDPSRVVVEGVYTHLACADDPESVMTEQQLRMFAEAIRTVRRRFSDVFCHAGASAAVLGHAEAAFDLVRVGLALYGVSPAPHLATPALRPAMTLLSRVIRTRRVPAATPVSYGATFRPVHETIIATVPVGYADGYPRALSNTGSMVIGGRRLQVAGRVCMDYTMLDAGEAPVRDGDEVTVFGSGLPAAEVASTAGTIPYELFCRVGRRVPRVYVRAGKPVAIRSSGGVQQPDEASRQGLEVR